MRSIRVLAAVALAAAVFAGAGYAAEYDRYDRYERGYRVDSPPPQRAASPPPQRHAQSGEPYLFGRIGVFEPNSERDGLEGYDSGFTFDTGIGSRVAPIFAVEGTFGAYGADADGGDLTVIPLTVGGRLIIPNPLFEPYIGAGLGIYFVSLDEDFSGIDEDNTEFGGYFSLGADFWLNPRIALNVEGKYHWVESEFTGNGYDYDVDLGGWAVNFGVRVSF